MEDFNGKVGENREKDTIGPFGVGVRNDNGERVVNFCKRHNLFATNTWFQQRKSAQHTWISPDKVTKNPIIIIIIITHIYIYRRHHSCNKSSLLNSNLCRLQRRREKIYKTTLAAVLNNSVFSLSLNKSSDGAERVLKLKLFQIAGAEQ